MTERIERFSWIIGVCHWHHIAAMSHNRSGVVSTPKDVKVAVIDGLLISLESLHVLSTHVTASSAQPSLLCLKDTCPKWSVLGFVWPKMIEDPRFAFEFELKGLSLQPVAPAGAKELHFRCLSL